MTKPKKVQTDPCVAPKPLKTVLSLRFWNNSAPLDLKPNFKVALNLLKDCIALTFWMAGSKDPPKT